jgi:hypothetical protein
MLRVSFDLAAVAAILISTGPLANQSEIDSLNSPTAQPIPSGLC